MYTCVFDMFVEISSPYYRAIGNPLRCRRRCSNNTTVTPFMPCGISLRFPSSASQCSSKTLYHPSFRLPPFTKLSRYIKRPPLEKRFPSSFLLHLRREVVAHMPQIRGGCTVPLDTGIQCDDYNDINDSKIVHATTIYGN